MSSSSIHAQNLLFLIVGAPMSLGCVSSDDTGESGTEDDVGDGDGDSDGDGDGDNEACMAASAKATECWGEEYGAAVYGYCVA